MPSNSLNCYTNNERDNLVKVSIGLSHIIQNPKGFTKKTIEETLKLSKDFLYIPEILKMQKELENYYTNSYKDSQLNLNFK